MRLMMLWLGTLWALLLSVLGAPSAAWAVCPPTEPILGPLTCSSTITAKLQPATGSTLGSLRTYGCGAPYAPLSQNGPESVAEFACQQTGSVTIQITNLDCDLDVYILGATCNESTGCVQGSTKAGTADDSITFTCQQGQTYYIVVEGYGFTQAPTYTGFCSPVEGNFTLSFNSGAGTGCHEDCDNGRDDDSDGRIDCADADCNGDPACCDLDHDLYPAIGICGGTDCNDSASWINPAEDEYCDSIDNDCDGQIDESSSVDARTYYRDTDHDVFGASGSSVRACALPPGYTSLPGDCDDTDSGVYPGATEVCDGVDQDCDTVVDEGSADAVQWYIDYDGDLFGASGPLDRWECAPPPGYVGIPGDCNDFDPTAWPGATEFCDHVDDDCDGLVDEAALDAGTWFADADGDLYGDPLVSTTICDIPPGYVPDGTDCNDAIAAIHPDADEVCNHIDDDCDGAPDDDALDATWWYVDADADLFGAGGVADLRLCESPPGYSGLPGDCDDADAGDFPGADEYCNGDDEDCDGTADDASVDAPTWYIDYDGDQFGVSGVFDTTQCVAPPGFVADFGDCDDLDPLDFPGAIETCNGDDENCDGIVDNDAVDATAWYPDADGDGWGLGSATAVVQCEAPPDSSSATSDCDDTQADIFPGALETCDGRDNDCDGSIDLGAPGAPTWYADDDGDLFGISSDRDLVQCDPPPGYSLVWTDCDDTRAEVNPDAEEVCNELDDDCDGLIDGPTATDITTWYWDADGDLFGTPALFTIACVGPPGYASEGGDCNDTNHEIFPGAPEQCDGLDNDCDAAIDEDGTTGVGGWYLDADGDTHGDPASPYAFCDPPPEYVFNQDDCDDADDSIYPGAAEVPYDGVDQDCDGADLLDGDGDGEDASVFGGTDCNDNDEEISTAGVEVVDGRDNDCDGIVDEGTDGYDDDGDGYTESGGDCDDADSAIHPGVVEDCDSVDQDCDGYVDEGTSCFDDDEDGWTEDEGDCNDSDRTIFPGAVEVGGDGIDQDCDGSLFTAEFDEDADGYSERGGDCVDTDRAIHPGAVEIVDGVDNDCDGLIDEGTGDFDDDGDGVTEGAGDCNDDDPTIYPGAIETSDGRDEDCDGIVDDGTSVSDDDGDGFTEEAGDCDDAASAINPGADEVLPGIDDDCDGIIDEVEGDADGDRFTVEDGDCDDTTGWAFPGGTEVCDGVDNDCNGTVDEGCLSTPVETDGPKTETPTGCACDQRGTGYSAMVLVALALARRRRR